MTPGARIQTAIECLDRIATGAAAEKVLTGWARGARHAGSKDRAAVRDHVFDALRRWWSCAALGGGQSGRSRMIGLLRAQGIDPAPLFDGAGYGPAPLDPDEAVPAIRLEPWQSLDCPPWLEADLRASLGTEFDAVMTVLQSRAPLFLRVNLARGDRAAAMRLLESDGIATRPQPLSDTALEVVSNPRAVNRSAAFLTGAVEVQDAASQAVIDGLPLAGAGRILDYCAGGGGKALAMAARSSATLHAHDADAGRMRDLPSRAARSGASIGIVAPDALSNEQSYDIVLVDAPCSGSGAWRRAPEGKIRLDRAGLDGLLALQARVLDAAAGHVAPGGLLVYVTCSMLAAENGRQVNAFRQARGGIDLVSERTWTPLEGGDGFFRAILRRQGDAC